MSEQSIPGDDNIAGSTDHEQHRTPAGEGQDAPLAQQGADHAEYAIFDGSGNESVAVVTSGPEGVIAEGTGPTSADAMKDAERADKLGTDFSPGVPTEQGENA